MASAPPPKHVAVVLFPGFQLLDITGPLDILNTLSRSTPLTLSILAATLDPVSTNIPVQAPYLESLTPSTPPKSNFGESIVPTHTFETAPKDIDTLIIPGGFGSRSEENIEGVVEFGIISFLQSGHFLPHIPQSIIINATRRKNPLTPLLASTLLLPFPHLPPHRLHRLRHPRQIRRPRRPARDVQQKSLHVGQATEREGEMGG